MKTQKHGKVFWKQQSKKFSGNSWDESMEIRLTGFFHFHRDGKGLNCGESTLLDINTQVTQVDSVSFEYSSQFKSLRIFARKSGSVNSIRVRYTTEGESRSVTVCRGNCSGNDGGHGRINILAEAFDTDSEEDLFYRLQKPLDEDEESRLAMDHGLVIKEIFQFNHEIKIDMPHHGRLSVKPENVTETEDKLSFSFVSRGTYNSLPFIIEVIKKPHDKKDKSVSLYELGIESAGYYSHDLYCVVLPEKKKEVLAFQERLKEMKKQSEK